MPRSSIALRLSSVTSSERYTRGMVRSFAKADFEQARARMGEHVYHTPIITSRLLSEKTGYDVRLKAELFQRGGSYKIRGPMNKFALLSDEQKRRGVICSSAGNHAQGVA